MGVKSMIGKSLGAFFLLLLLAGLLSVGNPVLIALAVFTGIVALILYHLYKFKENLALIRKDYPNFYEKAIKTLKQVELVIKASIVYYLVLALYVIFINPKLAKYYLYAVMVFGIVAYVGYEYVREVLGYGE